LVWSAWRFASGGRYGRAAVDKVQRFPGFEPEDFWDLSSAIRGFGEYRNLRQVGHKFTGNGAGSSSRRVGGASGAVGVFVRPLLCRCSFLINGPNQNGLAVAAKEPRSGKE